MQFELVFQLFLALSRLFLCYKERLEAVPALASLALSSRYVYIYIAITFIVIGKGPALIVAAVFRTSHISHTFESGGCRTS